jgi:hypothetical protein
MVKFEEAERLVASQSLFLVRSLGEFNEKTLTRLYDWATSKDLFFSIERLFKGNEQALVLYGAEDLPEVFPELDLLELEDYLIPGQTPSPKKTTFTQILGFDIPISGKHGFVRSSFLHNLEIEPTEQLFWQIVTNPVPVPEEDRRLGQVTPHFEVVVRTLMVAESSQKRVELARRILELLNKDFGFTENIKPVASRIIFDDYILRNFTEQKGNHFLNSQELLAMLDL